MLRAMSGKLLGGAIGVTSAAVAVARHVVWYVTYQVDGHNSARVDDYANRRRTRGS